MFWFHVPKDRIRGMHRNNRSHWWHSFREWLWPSMGVKALLRWMELKIKRNKSTAHRSALGAAIGIGVTFTPFFGLHLVLVFLISRLLQANFWVGAIATLVGNPWTFPIITFWTFNVGHFILGSDRTGPPLEDPPSIVHVWEHFSYFLSSYIWPMAVGGIPTGIVLAVLTYYLLHNNITHYHNTRSEILHEARKRMRKGAKVSGRVVHAIGAKLLLKSYVAGGKFKKVVLNAEHAIEDAISKKDDK